MAMNFSEEEKKKLLSDDSEIYQKREDGLDANSGQLKNLKGRKKREYFRQYYMGTVAIIVVIAILAVLFFKNAFEKKPQCALYIAIQDDILDVTATTEELGKPVGSDAENDKTTFITLYGLEGARSLAKQHNDAALAALADLGPEADFLREMAVELLTRSK